jgi:hypothetical protein
MGANDPLDPRILARLSVLDEFADRDPKKAAAGRAGFLQEASRLREAVSNGEEGRRNHWIDPLISIFFPRKEKRTMLHTLAALLVVFSLFLGGGGLTIAAAHDSLPDEALYGLKLAGEEAGFRLRVDENDRFEWVVRLIERRHLEIQTMLTVGRIPSDAVYMRFQTRLEHALQLAAEMPDEECVQAMIRLRERLQALSDRVPPEMLQTRTMLQERIQLLEQADGDPSQLREMLRTREKDQSKLWEMEQQQDRDRINRPTEAGATPQGSGGECVACTPQNGAGYGPGSQPTNGPGPQTPQGNSSSPGPHVGQDGLNGPGPQSTQTTSGGSGPQSTESPQGEPNGPGPQASSTPGAGSGSGGGGMNGGNP